MSLTLFQQCQKRFLEKIEDRPIVGSQVWVNDEVGAAVIELMDSNGRMLVRTPNGKRHVCESQSRFSNYLRSRE